MTTPARVQANNTFASFTLDALEKYEPDPADTIAGKGFLKKGCGCLVAGSTGIGKSVLVEQIALNVATGTPILGKIVVPQARTVLQIQAENDAETLKQHYEGILKGMSMKASQINDRLVTDHVYGLCGQQLASYLEQRIGEVKPDLIVLDPYQSYVGEVDINNTSAFLSFITPIERLMKMHRFAIILVAHTTKPRDRTNWNTRENAYMAAGSSTISNWARTTMELMPVGHETQRFRVTFGKNAERTGVLQEGSGEVCREIYLEHGPDPELPFWRVAVNQSGPSNSQYEEPIRQYLNLHLNASNGDIVREIGCNKSTVSRIRTRLEI